MTLALFILCFALIVALVIKDWRNAKETEVREDAWRLERTSLLNRIQAPEVEILGDEPGGEPAYAHFDDDEAFQ